MPGDAAERMKSQIGLTKDAGWELGVKRTVALPTGDVWRYLLGDGLQLWLGETTLGHDEGDCYETTAGVRGQIRSRIEYVRLRLTWKPLGRELDTTLQITVTPTASGTTIGLHQERLISSAERERLLAHWTDIVTRIVQALSQW